MSGVIFEVTQTRKEPFRFDQLGGYNLPLTNSVVAMRERLGGNLSRDAFAIVHYREDGSKMPLFRGYLNTSTRPTMGDLRYINEQILMLEAFLDDNNSDARWKGCCLPTNRYVLTDNQIGAIYVKCKNGVIGAAWLDYGDNRNRALHMAAFLCYTMGILNVNSDCVLWEAATQFLPEDTNLIPNVEVLRAIIKETVRAEARHTGSIVVTEIKGA